MTLPALPLFHNVAGQPVIVLGDGEAAAAKRRLVTRAGGLPVEDHPRARLAFVALEAPEPVVAALRARGILVNCVDRPKLCDFTTPAVVDRSPLLLAIGTGGASAGLAKAVRLRLEVLLPAGLGALATALANAREALRRRWPDPAARRQALDLALASGGPLDPLAAQSANAVERWLAADSAAPLRSAQIVLHSPDPDELTLGQARLLGSADVLAHGPDVPAAILDRARADAVRCGLEEAGTRAGLVVSLRMRA